MLFGRFKVLSNRQHKSFLQNHRDLCSNLQHSWQICTERRGTREWTQSNAMAVNVHNCSSFVSEYDLLCSYFLKPTGGKEIFSKFIVAWDLRSWGAIGSVLHLTGLADCVLHSREAAKWCPWLGCTAGCAPWLSGATSWSLQSPLVKRSHRLCFLCRMAPQHLGRGVHWTE